MKRVLLFTLCLLLAASIAAPAFATDIIVGAKAGYYIWRPFYNDLGASGMSDIDYGTGMLAGPVVSLLLSPDLTFSLAGLAGRQSTHWQSKFSNFDSDTDVSGGYYFDTLRIDIDSALSYRLSDNLKLFAGYKLLYLSTDYKYTEVRTAVPGGAIEAIDIQDMHIITPFHGPALGVGVSLPLNDRVFVAANLSALYMIGVFDVKKNTRHTSEPPPGAFVGVDDPFEKARMQQYGLNVEPAIGFNPGGGLPIISLGLRFQWLRVRFTETRDYNGGTDDWFDDYLYGMFVSAVYVF